MCPMKRGSRQLRLRLPERPAHGGRRPGAGRKPKGERAGVFHHGRPKVRRSSPVHVTLRILPHVWNLRSLRSLRVIGAALEGAKVWRTFRVVHFSAQGTCTSSSRPMASGRSPPVCRDSPSGSRRG